MCVCVTFDDLPILGDGMAVQRPKPSSGTPLTPPPQGLSPLPLIPKVFTSLTDNFVPPDKKNVRTLEVIQYSYKYDEI